MQFIVCHCLHLCLTFVPLDTKTGAKRDSWDLPFYVATFSNSQNTENIQLKCNKPLQRRCGCIVGLACVVVKSLVSTSCCVVDNWPVMQWTAIPGFSMGI